MKNAVYLICFLFFDFNVIAKCFVVEKVNEGKHKYCVFTLSDGDFEEFLKTFPKFRICALEFENANFVIELVNYSLPAFPNGTFENFPHLKSFRLEISKGSDLQLLSPLLPDYVVFENLRTESFVIDISDSSSLSGWKWEALSIKENELIEHFEFNAMRVKILRLDSNFAKIAGGRQKMAIRIIKCQLRWLGRDVFGPFSNLIGLELRKNFIERFERFHLPKDASKLRYIDLGENKLQSISWDLFNDLHLQMLYLDENNIKVLISETNIVADTSLNYVKGVLWPCECSTLSKLSKKITNLWENEDCWRTGEDDGELVTEIKQFCKPSVS